MESERLIFISECWVDTQNTCELDSDIQSMAEDPDACALSCGETDFAAVWDSEACFCYANAEMCGQQGTRPLSIGGATIYLGNCMLSADITL